MKKVFLSLLIVFSVVLLTGCGAKVDFDNSPRVVCQKTESEATGTTNTKYTLLFDENDKLTHFKADVDVTYNQQMPKEAMTVTEKAMKIIGLTPGFDFKSEVRDNGLSFSFSGKIKMLKTLIKQLNGNLNEDNITGDTKEEALNEFTGEGYTCEIFE